MKKILLIILGITLYSMAAQAQILNPVSWNVTAKKLKANVYELHLTATVKDGWTIYSQWTPEGGPEPTTIYFDKNTNLLLGGKAKEIGIMKKKHEEVFGVDVHYFEHKVDFVQLVKTKSITANKIISGKINFMTCDKEQCINDETIFQSGIEVNPIIQRTILLFI